MGILPPGQKVTAQAHHGVPASERVTQYGLKSGKIPVRANLDTTVGVVVEKSWH